MSIRLKCCYCTKTFFKSSEYYLHANEKHLSNIATEWRCCVACNNYYPNSDELKAHQSSAHPNHDKKPRVSLEDRIRCEFCETTFGDKQKFYRHCNKHHAEKVSKQWETCQECKMCFPNVSILKAHFVNAHARKKTQEALSDLKCSFCQKVFITKRSFYTHANSEHRKEIASNWFSCDVCGEFRPSQDVLLRHKIVHSTEKDWAESYKCDFCISVFSRSYIYYKHANKEHLEAISASWSPCDICNAYFPTFRALNNHKITAHHVKKDANEKLTCSFCSTTMSSATQFYKHCNRDHPDECAQEWVQCNECQTYFPNASVLQNHSNSAHPEQIGIINRVQCKFCPASFSRAQRYLKHANSVHKDLICKEWFLCQHCSTYHPSQSALKCHSNAAHKKEITFPQKRVPCQYCPSTFWGNAKYYKHANKEHAADLQSDWLPCEQCNNYLPNPAVLKLHVASAHTFKAECQFCKQSFTKGFDYYRHANIEHHQQIAKEWMTCIYCQKYFPTEDVVRDHDCDAGYTRCQFCSELFATQLEYFSHAGRAHINQIAKTWIPCGTCKILFPSKEMLTEHQATQHQNQSQAKVKPSLTLTCAFCKESFKSQEMYYEHANQVHLVELIESWEFCDACKNYVPNQVTLQNHDCTKVDFPESDDESMTQSDVASNLERDEMEQDSDEELPLLPLSVEINEGFTKNKDRSMTMNSSGASSSRMDDSDDNGDDNGHDDVETFEDNFSYNDSSNSGQGRKKHPGECNDCGEIFSSSSHMRRHYSSVHQKERNFKCHDCGKSFSQPDTLKKHQRFVHLEQRDFHCDICDRDFVEKKSLLRHNRNFHQDIAEIQPRREEIRESVTLTRINFDCSVCGKMFKLRWELEEHKANHHSEVNGDSTENAVQNHQYNGEEISA